MLHVDPTAAASAAFPADHEVLRAREWIAGARACGLVVAPWREKGSTIPEFARGGVMMTGRETDEASDYGAATKRFLQHPAIDVDVPKVVVFSVLCAELGIDPDDDDLCAKVNATMSARAEA